jgi:predicted NAD/FAD-binding protein
VPSVAEQAVLGAIHYDPTAPCCSTDTSVLPAAGLGRLELSARPSRTGVPVCLHYLLNLLPAFPPSIGGGVAEPGQRDCTSMCWASSLRHRCFEHSHRARQQLPDLQGQQNLLCGAWAATVFMKTGSKSGLNAARCKDRTGCRLTATHTVERASQALTTLVTLAAPCRAPAFTYPRTFDAADARCTTQRR